MIEYNMRLNLQSARTLYTDIVLTAGDVLAYRLNFSFLSNNVPYDVTGHVLAVKGKRSDGQVVIDQGEVTADGEVYYEMTSSMYAVAGRLSLEVALVTPLGGYVTTKELILEVRAGHGDGDLATENTTPIIVRLMDQNIRTEQSVHKLSQEVIELAAVPAQERVLSDQSYGNAFRGTAKGEVIRLDDVSPLEHEVKCKVVRKNLWNNDDVTLGGANWTKTDTGYQFTRSETYTGGAYLNAKAIKLSKGTTVTFSTNESNTLYIYKDKVYGTKLASVIGTTLTYTLTEDAAVVPTIIVDSAKNKVTATDIQFEIGSVKTEYMPYVDPSVSVNLLRMGGNLIGMENITQINNYPITVKDDVITLIPLGGLLYGFRCLSPLGETSWEKILKVGETYTFSVDSVSDYEPEKWGWRLRYMDGTYTNPSNSLSTTITITQPITSVYFYVDFASKVFENNVTVKNPRCELGSDITADSSYSCETYPVNEDGSVVGVTSVSPTMTLMTDVSGTILEAEYNRDSNKVYDQLVNAIISLGGNV